MPAKEKRSERVRPAGGEPGSHFLCFGESGLISPPATSVSLAPVTREATGEGIQKSCTESKCSEASCRKKVGLQVCVGCVSSGALSACRRRSYLFNGPSRPKSGDAEPKARVATGGQLPEVERHGTDQSVQRIPRSGAAGVRASGGCRIFCRNHNWIIYKTQTWILRVWRLKASKGGEDDSGCLLQNALKEDVRDQICCVNVPVAVKYEDYYIYAWLLFHTGWIPVPLSQTSLPSPCDSS